MQYNILYIIDFKIAIVFLALYNMYILLKLNDIILLII